MALFSRPSNEDSRAVDLFLYGAIPDLDWNTFEEINTDREFVDIFKEAENNYERINIHINSPGGFIDEGLVMFNTIRASKKDVHTYNDGLAASMGSVVLLAGKTVHAPATSIVMIHSAWGGVMGNKDDIRSYADGLEVYENAIITAVAAKTGGTEEDIRAKYFDGKDHFLTGKQAKEAGLIDVLEDYEADVPSNVQNMSYDQIVNHYSNYKTDQVMNLIDFFSGKAKAEKNTVEVSTEELENLRTASEEAVNKIEKLEGAKAESEKKIASLEKEKSTAETAKAEAEEKLAAEQEAHKATTDAFNAFKEEAGDTHTIVDKSADDYQAGGEAKKYSFEEAEEQVQAKAEEADEKMYKTEKSK